jgi:hypothetical protein
MPDLQPRYTIVLLQALSIQRAPVIPKPARSVSLEEIDAAIEAGATQKFMQNGTGFSGCGGLPHRE